MLIHLNTQDTNIVASVHLEMQRISPDSKIHTDPDFVKHYVPGSKEHLLTSGPVGMPDDVATYRWVHLYMASLGGRFWVDTEDEKINSPYFAGSFDKIGGLRQVAVDANFAEGRAHYFKSFGVNYLGRVFSDPRTMVLLDNKKDKLLSPSSNEDIFNILSTYPESTNPEVASWGNLSLVSAGNITKLEAFLDYLSETNVLAYTTGGFSKLKFIGRDFGEIAAPRPDPQYGLEIRNTASRMKPVI